ncbi:hypothetical protein QT235_17545 [Geobacillus stearothermophilus]|nr:hypothetical protein QT235_17545 [Geobacillus stearothermophilus]
MNQKYVIYVKNNKFGLLRNLRVCISQCFRTLSGKMTKGGGITDVGCDDGCFACRELYSLL